ncbi:MAG: hypothetical protein SGPRY_003964 [Prymnesium sp.]
MDGAALSGVAVGWLLRAPRTLLRLRLMLGSASRTLVLSHVKVPIALLPSATAKRLSVDAEGLVLCDVSVSFGKISAVRPAGTIRTGLTTASINMRGCVLLSCWTDPHTHLVKTHTHLRARNTTGTINEALAVEVNDSTRWAACACCRPVAFSGQAAGGSRADEDLSSTPCPNAHDISRRMEFAVASAFHHGTRSMRTHLDGVDSRDPKHRATVYAAFDSCRERWEKKGLCIQGVANLYLPLWGAKEVAEPHVDEVVRHNGVILGAYCGNVADTPAQQTEEALDALFRYAHKHSLQVDLHIDETNDERCCCLLPLINSLRRARARGYASHVLLGHCSSLALQSEQVREAVIHGLQSLPPVSVVCNPSTNLALQDRRGSAAPHCKSIELSVPRTPKWRGLTIIQELAAAGVSVAAATDNVRDWWHPYGDYDGLLTWKLAITLGHLDTAANEGAWAHIVSDAPAAAIGTSVSESGSSFQEGAVADLILFPSARHMTELLSRPHSDRIVLRAGLVQHSALPGYEELDDLVCTPTKLAHLPALIHRGATLVQTTEA